MEPLVLFRNKKLGLTTQMRISTMSCYNNGMYSVYHSNSSAQPTTASSDTQKLFAKHMHAYPSNSVATTYPTRPSSKILPPLTTKCWLICLALFLTASSHLARPLSQTNRTGYFASQPQNSLLHIRLPFLSPYTI